jgi:hypothetical protein
MANNGVMAAKNNGGSGSYQCRKKWRNVALSACEKVSKIMAYQ